MLKRISEWSLNNRLVVLVLLFALMVAGGLAYTRLATDAFPDVSPIMVPIFAEAHGMAPEEIERLIAYPIESAMNGLPGVTELKSTSAFGMAVVYVYFEDDMDIFFCRQIVSERLGSAMAELPEMHEPPKLGPISTGLGEVFMYYLTIDDHADTGGKDRNTYLRELNDWVVKLQLQAVPGVTGILSMGGHVLQYQVRVDPHALNRYHLTEAEIVEAITANNDNVGGQFLVIGGEEYLVRGIGLLEQLEDLRSIQVKVSSGGTPIRLTDVAEVDYGNQVRRGVVVLNGEQEIVAGIVLKLFGENSSQVIARLRDKIPKVQASLPSGVHLVPYYDQSRLVDNAVATVRNAMALGGLLVLLSLLLFLGNLRTAITVAVAIPFCALTAFLLMGWQGLSANLMSLGGIAVAIGMLGDGAIVMVENIYRHLSNEHGSGSKRERVVTAATEVSRPILFSVAIIVIVFLPLLTLEGVEGNMFSPMALTISYALLGSLVAALVLTPVLASFLLRIGEQQEPRLIAWLKRLYQPLLVKAMAHRALVTVASGIAFAGALLLLTRTGTEFIPVLDEGQIQVNITMSPSISLDQATKLVSRMQRTVNQLPEVDSSVAKIGRPEAGSHPHPVNFGMIQAALKPINQWQDHANKAELIETINHRLSSFPGVQLNFTQPIQNLFDELLSGVRTQLAIKLFGDDLQQLRSTAEEIKESIEGVPGLVDLASEQSFGQPQVQVIADRRACARYNVNVSDILEIVELDIGGEVVDELFLNTRRFGIHMRFQEPYRSDPDAIRNILVHTADGALIPLSQVAEVREVIGPIQVNREKNQRRWIISANVRGRDMGSVVEEIKQRIDESIDLPPGYHLEYGGQFKNQERAMARLTVIVPTAFALIFLMLYLSLGKLRYAALIFVNVPLALIGGVLGLTLFGEYLSVPASVGFIALFGIAVQNGLVLVTCVNQRIEAGGTVREAVIDGALLRLRPVLMTALTTMLGLTPLLLSTGMGSEVQRPLAVVVVFGLLSSTFLTLVLIPALYEWFRGKPVG
jgi:cobalt-zinc-cadmium resistance protein CzcA